jgi:hypothetical protein
VRGKTNIGLAAAASVAATIIQQVEAGKAYHSDALQAHAQKGNAVVIISLGLKVCIIRGTDIVAIG